VEYLDKHDMAYVNEKSYFYSESKKRGIDLIYADLNILSVLVKVSSNFNINNILLLRALFYLNKMERRAKIREYMDSLLEIIAKEDFFSELFEESGLDKELFINLLDNYLKKNNKKKIDEISKNDDIIPTPIDNKTSLNKIMKEMSYFRDVNMIKKLEGAIQKYDNVLYALGKNHIVRQERALRMMFN
jgi:hypothetical protein